MKKVIVISTSLRPNTMHCDFYDGGVGNYILRGTISEFFNKNL